MSGDKKPSVLKNYIIGGVSGMFATTIIQPIDFIKVQLQVKGEGGKARANPFTVLFSTIKDYGVGRLYTGLGAGLLRQATYTTARMGTYKSLMDYGAEINQGKAVPFYQKCLFSMGAGGFGAIFGNPADLILIRMQTDHTLPEAQRRNYTSVANAFTQTIKKDGFLSLWRGCLPTVYRAMALNFGMLGPNDQAKEMLKSQFGMFTGINVASSSIAAFFACVFSLPFDNVKTKFQRMAKLPDGTYPYKSFMDCFTKTMAKEGFWGFYVGFNTFVVRIAPHVVITLLTVDYLTQNFNKPK